MDDLSRETIDVVAISRLQAAYADVVTRRAWLELHDIFRPDAPVQVDTITATPIELTGPEEVGAFISGAIEHFEFFEFVILNTHIVTAVGGDVGAARARLYMCELRQASATGQWSNAFGIYHDDYRREDGRWWFARRRYQSLARIDLSGRAEVFPFPHHAGFD
ncbi:MAG: nuclear transport factor 2 family protein [Acidimicrobiia bacterium]